MSDRTITVALPGPALDALGMSGEVRVTKGGVTAVDAPQGKVWVKTVEPPTKTGRRKAMAVAGRILPIPILRPSITGKGGDTLILQAEQTRLLRDAGFNPARILYADPDFLILADGGVNMEAALRDLEREEVVFGDMDRAAAQAILLQITADLSRLHRAGFAHGRPKMRDFAWQRVGAVGDGRPAEGTVTILDLEERPWSVMPMAAAQARDVYLWLVDLCSYPVPHAVADEAMVLYAGDMREDTARELRKLRRSLSLIAPPVRGVTKTPLRNREMLGAIRAYDVLKKHVE